MTAALPLTQTTAYADTLALMGRDVLLLPMPDGPPMVALQRRAGPLRLILLPRADLSCLSFGGLGALPASALLIVVPDAPARLRGCWPMLTPQHVAELHRPGGADRQGLMARMHGKWRNRLRRALDGPLRVRSDPYDPSRHAALMAQELAQRRRRGYRAYPHSFFAAWAAAAQGTAKIHIATLKGEDVAFMLFLHHGPVATYAAGWTGAEGRRHHAHTLLLWEVMLAHFEQGGTRLDLGPVETDREAGLARFKLGCGAEARSLGPTLLSPPGFRVSP